MKKVLFKMVVVLAIVIVTIATVQAVLQWRDGRELITSYVRCLLGLIISTALIFFVTSRKNYILYLAVTFIVLLVAAVVIYTFKIGPEQVPISQTTSIISSVLNGLVGMLATQMGLKYREYRNKVLETEK